MDIKFEHPQDPSFGDLSVFAKEDPEKMAEQLENVFSEDMIKSIDIVGNFVNIFLKQEYLIKEAEKINYEMEFRNDLGKKGNSKIMIIDYSAPNIAKPFGIGHLRSTNIGQAIYNIYKILGWNCIGDNHLGDWGTQFGKLIVAIKKWAKKDVGKMTVEDLEELYVKFHEHEDEKLLEEARDWFIKLEKGDKEASEIWKKCVDISTEEFNRVYEMLNVHIDETLGEAFYQDKLQGVIKEMIDKGITKESEGATIVEFDDKTVELVKKSNLSSTYFDRDMATIKYRMERWKPDLIVYEVGSDQSLYFKHLFEAAEKMGWVPTKGFYHVAHGLIRWKDGKFSTRKGQTIHLKEIIEKTIEMAKKIAPENDEETIREIAVGAIKFNDISQDPKKDVIFDWDRMMSLDGDSGPYLQYTYARAMSVLKKTEVLEQKDIGTENIEVNSDEMRILREVYKFKEKIAEAAERYNPGVLAEFLLSVARKYNEFYAKNRIIGEKEEDFRVFLTRVVASLLHLGLELLGIKTVEKM